MSSLDNSYAALFEPIQIGPKTKSIPVTKVSRDAGNYLHWSGDSMPRVGGWSPQ